MLSGHKNLDRGVSDEISRYRRIPRQIFPNNEIYRMLRDGDRVVIPSNSSIERFELFNNAWDPPGNFRRAVFRRVKIRNSFFTGDFENATFRRADLSGFWFHNRFQSCNFTGVDFRNSILNYSYFHDCNFTNANLHGADLIQTHLTISNFTNANLRGANLTNAHFTNANLRGADLTGADLTGAVLTFITYDRHTKFPSNFDKSRLDTPTFINDPFAVEPNNNTYTSFYGKRRKRKVKKRKKKSKRKK